MHTWTFAKHIFQCIKYPDESTPRVVSPWHRGVFDFSIFPIFSPTERISKTRNSQTPEQPTFKIRGAKLAWFSKIPASNRNRPTTINFFCIKNWIRIFFFMEYDWNTYLISVFSCCVVVWCVSKLCYMNIHERHSLLFWDDLIFVIFGWFLMNYSYI